MNFRTLVLLIPICGLSIQTAQSAERITLPPGTAAYVAAVPSELDTHVATLNAALETQLPRPLDVMQLSSPPASVRVNRAWLAALVLKIDRTLAPVVAIPTTDFAAAVGWLGGDADGDDVVKIRMQGYELYAVRWGEYIVVADAPISDLLTGSNRPRSFSIPNYDDLAGTRAIVAGISPDGTPSLRDWLKRDDGPDTSSDQSTDTLIQLLEPARRYVDRLIEQLGLTGIEPSLDELLRGTDSLSVAAQVDDDANLILDLQAKWVDEVQGFRASGDMNSHYAFRTDDFALVGGGTAPAAYLQPLITALARQQLAALAKMGGDEYRPADVDKFVTALGNVVGDVEHMGILTRLPAQDDPIYSNSLLLVESVDAETLCKKVGAAIENWNWLMDSAESDLVLQFDSEPIKIAEYAGTRYSIDMRSIAGPPLPEMLAVLEAFFGDGARLKIVVLPINGRRVLVANSTAQQIASVLNEISKTDPPANPHWTAARQLLPTALHQVWQLNLHDHTAWRQRILHAGHETIVGGPLVKIFPAGPPLTWGMRFQPQRLRLTVAVQGETLKHALSRH